MSSPLANAHSIEDLRSLAQRRLPRGVFDFFDGGAEDESTLRANREAFARRMLWPRVLRDVSTPDLSTGLFGRRMDLPLVVAPTGAIGAGWPAADVLVARAAAAAGVPYTLSTTATSTIEEVARATDGRFWFQLYVLHDQAFCESLVARAEAAGCEALVVTVDLPVGGQRERDLRNRFTVPLRPSARLAWDLASHPRWMGRLLLGGLPRFENLRGFEGRGDAGASIAARVGRSLDASFDWDGLARLRDRWKGRLLLKGVLHPQDALQAAQLGVDAIWVSNHGGRQLDGAVSALDALEQVAQALQGRVPLLLDSGVRRGTDVMKALAIGATAVAVGRATLYGVAAAGEAGARRALDLLAAELQRAMQMCGVARVGQIDGALLRAGPG